MSKPETWVPFNCPFSGHPTYIDCFEIVAVEGADDSERSLVRLRNVSGHITVNVGPFLARARIEATREAIRRWEARQREPAPKPKRAKVKRKRAR